MKARKGTKEMKRRKVIKGKGERGEGKKLQKKGEIGEREGEKRGREGAN